MATKGAFVLSELASQTHQFARKMQQFEEHLDDGISYFCGGVPYLPLYNAHFFPAEKAPKIEMRIIHGILCFRHASLISM